MLAYLVREHKTRKTRTIRKKDLKGRKQKLTEGLKNVMQEDQKGCNRNNIRAGEELIVGRAEQHEHEE